MELEALRRRLHHAPRPLKKRSSITEPEGPAGPNIQKLLYQKTTLAAMETVPMDTVVVEDGSFKDDKIVAGHQHESVTPSPLPLRSPAPDPAPCRSLLLPVEDREEEEEGRQSPARLEGLAEESVPYPPPPYHSREQSEQGDGVTDPPPREVTGQVVLPPASVKV